MLARCVIKRRNQRVVLGNIVGFAPKIFSNLENFFAVWTVDDYRVGGGARVAARASIDMRRVRARRSRRRVRLVEKPCARGRRRFRLSLHGNFRQPSLCGAAEASAAGGAGVCGGSTKYKIRVHVSQW